MSWKPIETAPKDGTYFISHRFHNGVSDVATVRWQNGKLGQDGWNYCEGRYFPTHWMPLPEPPK